MGEGVTPHLKLPTDPSATHEKILDCLSHFLSFLFISYSFLPP